MSREQMTCGWSALSSSSLEPLCSVKPFRNSVVGLGLSAYEVRNIFHITLGLFMFVAGLLLTRAAKMLYDKAAGLAITVGLKARGSRTGKAATFTGKVIAHLLTIVFFVVLFAGPVSLMTRGAEMTGWVNWTALSDAVMNNFLGVICFPFILASIKVEANGWNIKTAFDQPTK